MQHAEGCCFPIKKWSVRHCSFHLKLRRMATVERPRSEVTRLVKGLEFICNREVQVFT